MTQCKSYLHGGVAMLAMALFVSAGAKAQDFPNKPLRIVVANTPGSTSDSVSRIMGSEMAKLLGQAVVVDNRPGASSRIGYEHVAKGSAPDGYTMVCVLIPELSVLPVIFKDLPFDPVKDLPPVIGFAESRYPLASFSGAPWKTFQELVAYAKANPGKLNYGSTSVIGQLHGAAIFSRLGLQATFIPYKAAATYLQAMTTGEIQMAFTSEASAVGLQPKIKILAETGDTRSANFRDVPTFAELGFPEMQGLSQSLHVPLGTSKAIIDRLHTTAARVLQQPEVRAQFAKIQFEVVEQSPDTVAKKVADLTRLYRDVASKVNVALP